jgi:uncharacterized protein
MAATPSATRNYFERLKAKGKPVRFAPLGSTDLQVSRVGFGCYRIHEFEPDHREALKKALVNGCNLIDTSSNYTDGSSERLVGEVLMELFDSGEIKREEIVVVTKAGYIQGKNLANAKARAARGDGFPDTVEFQPDCWHNISPEFLEEQITNSLERLRLSTLDVVLLHNPEYYLKASGSREVYYQRIEKAFRHLESERSKGRIRFFGISSNTFPEPESRSDFTSLQRALEVAATLAKPSHFAVIQLPFNLFESGAALVPNNQRETVLDYAAKAKLGILTNRPFNADQRGRLTRLTSFPKHNEVEVKGGLHTTLGRAVELEKKAPGYPKPHQGFQWAHLLRDRIGDLDDVLVWREALYHQILPSIRQALAKVPASHESWSAEFQSTMQEFLRLVTWDLENLAAQKSELLADQVTGVASELKSSPTLSQKMIRLYTSFPQISSVLVGMRSADYVDDALAAGEAIPTPKAIEVLTRFQRHKS